MNDSIEKEIEGGGPWLSAARTWLQWNISDTMEWGSCKSVSLPFFKFTDIARTVAAAAIRHDRLTTHALLEEAYERFRKYEMDVDSEAPEDHKAFMRRLAKALNH